MTLFHLLHRNLLLSLTGLALAASIATAPLTAMQYEDENTDKDERIRLIPLHQDVDDTDATCLTNLFERLKIEYKPHGISNLDHDFAKLIRPYFFNPSNFKELSTQEKNTILTKFLKIIDILNWRYDRDWDGCASGKPRGSIWSHTNMINHDLILAIQEEYTKVLEGYSCQEDQKKFQEQYKALIIHSAPYVSEPLLRAILIDAILMFSGHDWDRESLKDFCVADLAEIMRENFGQITTTKEKICMVLSGNNLPVHAMGRASSNTIFVTLICYAVGAIFIGLPVTIVDHDAALGFGLAAIVPCVVVGALVLQNYRHWKAKKQYKVDDCILF